MGFPTADCAPASLGQVNGAPRDMSATDSIQLRLNQIRDRLSGNTQRVIEFGARAFGGSPVGSDKTNGNRPQAAGNFAAINSVLDDIDGLLGLQQDAITFAERIA